MEFRTLKYFLTVAREENITRAAALLHLTQPTLSRQLMQLEEELGVALFQRGRYQTVLTEEGVIFRQRAQEIVSLVEKTGREFSDQKDEVAGVLSVGSAESKAMWMLPEFLEEFSRRYPRVQFDMCSGCSDDVRDKVDRGLLDVGILTEPYEIARYEHIRFPQKDRWGLLMRRDDALASREGIRMEEMRDLPLIVPKRELLISEIAGWFGDSGSLHPVATYNLLLSSVPLVERGLGYAVCMSGAGSIREGGNTCFVPFVPERAGGSVMIWKKNRPLNRPASLFVRMVREMLEEHADTGESAR